MTSIRQVATRSESHILTGAIALSLIFASCGGDGSSATEQTSAGPNGSSQSHPTAGLGSQSFFVDGNQGGGATLLGIDGVFWGRMVNVVDADSALQHVNFVIGENIVTDNFDYVLTSNPVTEVTTLRILHLAGTPEYLAAISRADDGLVPIQRKSLDPGELPPYSLAPRNAAIVIRFNDLLSMFFDEGTNLGDPSDDRWRDFSMNDLIDATSGLINPNSVQVQVGNPPSSDFAARVFPDPNYGDTADFDGDGIPEFFPTRIIIDPTTSQIESQQTSPPLAINALGLPSAVATGQPNVAIRIPSQKAGPVTALLHTPSNPTHVLATPASEAVDESSPTRDVIRALRSGGDSAVTGDVNNGFLSDQIAPRIVGRQAITIGSVCQPFFDQGANCAFNGSEQPGDFIVSFTYNQLNCAITPKPGDVLRQGGVFAEVFDDGSLSGQNVSNLGLRVIEPLGAVLTNGSGNFLSTYDPTLDLGNEGCFLTFTPAAGLPPAGDVSPNVQRISVRFTEAMNPASLLPFDTMTLTSVSPDVAEPDATDFVIGEVVPSADRREYSFVPSLALAHQAGAAESYFLKLVSGANGPRDLAGNPVAQQLPEILFRLDPTATTEVTGGLVLRFNEASEIDNEVPPAGPAREIRGQILFNPSAGRIRPRPVNRFSIPVDRSQATIGIMTAFPGGVQTPLSPLGSKLQTLWRYVDMGFTVSDETNYNIDVEGLSWSPATGGVLLDFYEQFEIRLSHSRFQPDEVLDNYGFPVFPNSGVTKTYASNVFDQVNDAPRVVHPRSLGYLVDGSNSFMATSMTTMQPYPLNRDGDIANYRYYTYRDTALLGTAAPGPRGMFPAGAPLQIEAQVTGGASGAAASVYAAGSVPTVGLPLLMEFRCYPVDDALGLNGFDIALAVNSSSTPNFRAFSTGGFNIAQVPQVKNPDTQPTATGGFNPAPLTGPPGQATVGVDNSFYLGQIDLVTRVSRAHTIWFDSGFTGGAQFSTPVVEPSAGDQPLGTSIELAFRGITGTTPPEGVDALMLDAYGDPLVAGPNPGEFIVGPQSPAEWSPTIQQINGSRFFQVRVSFFSNTETNLTPELSALGFSFQQ